MGGGTGTCRTATTAGATVGTSPLSAAGVCEAISAPRGACWRLITTKAAARAAQPIEYWADHLSVGRVYLDVPRWGRLGVQNMPLLPRHG